MDLGARYEKRFARIAAKGGGWVPGFNFAAFLHSSAWFAYRRMYFFAALNLLAPWALIVGLVFVNWHMEDASIDTAAQVVLIAYAAAVFVVLPVFADAIYYRQAKAQQLKPPSVWTALGAAAVVVFTSLVIVAAVMPTHNYPPRAKVSEAILAASAMRTEITEFHAEKGRLPSAAEAGRFRMTGKDTNTRYVESIVYDAPTRRIVVTLREVHPGKKFALQAVERDGKLDRFVCGPLDLEEKLMPGSCREKLD